MGSMQNPWFISVLAPTALSTSKRGTHYVVVSRFEVLFRGR